VQLMWCYCLTWEDASRGSLGVTLGVAPSAYNPVEYVRKNTFCIILVRTYMVIG
jgi:hypothetical protein